MQLIRFNILLHKFSKRPERVRQATFAARLQVESLINKRDANSLAPIDGKSSVHF